MDLAFFELRNHQWLFDFGLFSFIHAYFYFYSRQMATTLYVDI